MWVFSSGKEPVVCEREGPCSAALTPALRKLQPAAAAEGDGGGWWRTAGSPPRLSRPFHRPRKSTNVTERWVKAARGVSPLGWDNNRGEDGELGLDTKAFFAGENAGLQQPGGPSQPFKSPTRLGYQRFRQFWVFFIFIRVGPPFGVPPNRSKTSNIGVMCRVTRFDDHGRFQATWSLSAESRSAAGRPPAPSGPLRAHEHRRGGSVATRKSVGKPSRYRSPASAYVTQQTFPIHVAPAKTLISAILQSCNTIWSWCVFFSRCFFYLFILHQFVCLSAISAGRPQWIIPFSVINVLFCPRLRLVDFLNVAMESGGRWPVPGRL